jgi:peptidoglycan/LPS O-acetylase OafA/YrhL
VCGVTSPDQPVYRPDIDGLRAVAVLGVIFFHAGFPWIKGGYVGVDVFFVISGFLITGILLRELGEGRFSLARFYERRARRILPAMLAVVAVTLAAGALVQFPADLRVVARSIVGVLVFAANVLFWRGLDFVDVTLVNYFGQRTHEQPMLHTWSLAVEEQYYLLFPAALLVVWRIRRAWVFPLLVAATVVSLAFSAVTTPLSPGVAFYLLPARIWELLAGGLLAWWVARRDSPQVNSPLREWTAAAGLVLIVIAMLQFDSRTPFPGLYALVPVAGSALLIHSAPGTLTGRVLSIPGVVFVGLISYSAYLWHQPLFAMARYVSLSGEMTTPVAIGLSVATLLLAAVTWRFVETPFRDRRRVSSHVVLWGSVAGVLAVAVPAAVLGFGGVGGRRSPIATNVLGQSVLALFTDCNTHLQPTRRLGPGCLLDPSSSAPLSFVVVGDSHAEALYPAFAWFSHVTGHQGRLFQHFGCSPLLEEDASTSVPGCRLQRQQALDLISANQLTRVIVVSRYSNDEYLPRDSFAARFERMVADYAARGATVYVVLQVPEHPRFDRRQYLRAVLRQRFLGIAAAPEIQRMSVSRAEHERRQAFVNDVFRSYRNDPRVRFVDVTSALCSDASCMLGTTSAPYYRDGDHMSDVGARAIGDALTQQLITSW